MLATGCVNSAGRLASFNPDDANPLRAITQTHAPILLIHSRSDEFIPWQHSQRLHDAAPDHSKLILVDGNCDGRGDVVFTKPDDKKKGPKVHKRPSQRRSVLSAR